MFCAIWYLKALKLLSRMDPSCLIWPSRWNFLKLGLLGLVTSRDVTPRGSGHPRKDLQLQMTLYVFSQIHKFGGEKSENKSSEFRTGLWQNDPMGRVQFPTFTIKKSTIHVGKYRIVPWHGEFPNDSPPVARWVGKIYLKTLQVSKLEALKRAYPAFR